MDSNKRTYTILAVCRERKPANAHRGTYPYNFVTVGTLHVSADIARQLCDGDDEAIERVGERFREHGLSGPLMFKIALGGRGYLAAVMKKRTNWTGTGMPKIWEGVL